MTLIRLPLSIIVDAQATQVRLKLSKETIDRYADLIREGVELPPIAVFNDGESYWLSDGFHRFAATAVVNGGFEAGDILAEVKDGTLRDAIAYALSANSAHGLPRNGQDRRRAVSMALSDPEWQQWSNVAIAKLCNVSEFLVRQVREELSPRFNRGEEPLARKFVTKHGSEAVMTIEPKAKTETAATADSGGVAIATKPGHEPHTFIAPDQIEDADELTVETRNVGIVRGLYIGYGWDSVIVPFDKIVELKVCIDNHLEQRQDVA